MASIGLTKRTWVLLIASGMAVFGGLAGGIVAGDPNREPYDLPIWPIVGICVGLVVGIAFIMTRGKVTLAGEVVVPALSFWQCFVEFLMWVVMGTALAFGLGLLTALFTTTVHELQTSKPEYHYREGDEKNPQAMERFHSLKAWETKQSRWGTSAFYTGLGFGGALFLLSLSWARPRMITCSCRKTAIRGAAWSGFLVGPVLGAIYGGIVLSRANLSTAGGTGLLLIFPMYGAVGIPIGLVLGFVLGGILGTTKARPE